MCAGSCLALFVEDVPLFHEKSRTVFRPTSGEGYFGYTVLLKQGNPFELLVGAPKARMAAARGRPGTLHRCTLALADAPVNVSCAAHVFSPPNKKHTYGAKPNYFEDDMWLGASLTDVTEDTLLVKYTS
ncbi:hypothetical protein EVAR_39094_1 [Eumeta japonica]|uniref:Uncharacterized protein n=1 Tax=Eumeta variegata TaxID=151549 RepID=A0A4C1X823_EUMVA|nr:hypothetical protein EVAR_39094_1 [Eumeta japonica]